MSKFIIQLKKLSKNFENNKVIIKVLRDINLNFELADKLKVDFLNYKKYPNKVAEIFLNLNTKKNQFFFYL